MRKTELSDLLKEITLLTKKAGREILEVASWNTKDAQTKSDGSPVTVADQRAHEVIVSGLANISNLPILSEEGDVEGTLSRAPQEYWAVDPLDGTKEFVNNYPEYTVNIALIQQGKPACGVVYIPPADTIYCGINGDKAWKEVSDSQATPLQPAARSRDQNKTLRAAVSRSHSSEETEEFLRKLGIKNVIGRGSSLKMCAVAEGEADIYPRLGPTSFWDTAAGNAIALGAGCNVIDSCGEGLNYFLNAEHGVKHQDFIVFNPHMLNPSHITAALS